MAASSEYRGEEDRSLDRLLGLSDGVFAFALTLLVLDLVLPALPTTDHTNGALAGALVVQLRQFLNYLLSFFFVSFWWVVHHRNFRYVQGYDTRLLWLNLLFLLPVTLTPYFTRLVDQYPEVQLASILSCLNQLAATTMSALLWWYASHDHRLVGKQLSDSLIRLLGRRMSIMAFVFIAAIGVSFLSVSVLNLYWVVIIPILVYLFRRIPVHAAPAPRNPP